MLSSVFALKKGESKFTITASDDQLITSVNFIATGGIVEDVRQVRIDGIKSIPASDPTITAVPEPSTASGLCGAGFLDIGGTTTMLRFVQPDHQPNQDLQRDRLRAVFLLRYNRTRASFRRSAVSAIPTPMTISASVALKLPGAMQLIQVPMIDGASYMVRVPSTHPG